jgi:hypothetical protein
MELNSHLTEDGALLVGGDVKPNGDDMRVGEADSGRAGTGHGSPTGADSKGTDAKDGAEGAEGGNGPSTGECRPFLDDDSAVRLRELPDLCHGRTEIQLHEFARNMSNTCVGLIPPDAVSCPSLLSQATPSCRRCAPPLRTATLSTTTPSSTTTARTRSCPHPCPAAAERRRHFSDMRRGGARSPAARQTARLCKVCILYCCDHL